MGGYHFRGDIVKGGKGRGKKGGVGGMDGRIKILTSAKRKYFYSIRFQAFVCFVPYFSKP